MLYELQVTYLKLSQRGSYLKQSRNFPKTSIISFQKWTNLKQSLQRRNKEVSILPLKEAMLQFLAFVLQSVERASQNQTNNKVLTGGAPWSPACFRRSDSAVKKLSRKKKNGREDHSLLVFFFSFFPRFLRVRFNSLPTIRTPRS